MKRLVDDTRKAQNGLTDDAGLGLGAMSSNPGNHARKEEFCHDEITLIQQPDFSWFDSITNLEGHQFSINLNLNSACLNSLINISDRFNVGMPATIAYAVHRLIQIYGHVEETALQIETTENPLLSVLHHTEIEPLSVIESIKHLCRNISDVSIWSPGLVDMKIITMSFQNEYFSNQGCSFILEISQKPTASFKFISNTISEKDLNDIMATFETMLTYVVNNPEENLTNVPYLNESQLFSLKKEWNSTLAKFPSESKTLLELFEEIVLKYPERIAILREDVKLTYAQLDAKCSELASRLCALPLDITGVDNVIALYLDKSEYAFISILAIFKVGCAYVPLDLTYPPARVKSILCDTGAKYVLLNRKYKGFEAFANIIAIDVESIDVKSIDAGSIDVESIDVESIDAGSIDVESIDAGSIDVESIDAGSIDVESIDAGSIDVESIDAKGRRVSKTSGSITIGPNDPIHVKRSQFTPRPFAPSSLAYIIFTSGTSNGKPKGIMTEHRNVTNYISDMSVRNFGPDPESSREVILQLSNYVFDVSVDQMWLGLANGLTCLIPPQKVWYDPEIFYSYLQKHRVTHISGTPSFLKQFNWDRVPSLRRLIFGGEKLSSETYKRLRGTGHYKLVSMFGPTETTIIAAHYPISEFTSCVGHPMANAAFYVLDVSKKLVPLGAIGELYIGGRGVCRGYLNRPELNAQSFMENPFGGPFERLYRTGDLVRRLENGMISFICRTDGQIKIRGNRIEVNEIGHMLLKFPHIEDAVVISREKSSGGDPILVAYYISAIPLAEKEIVSYLSEKLPEFMVPYRIIRIQKFPLTITGKLDTRMLPDPLKLTSNLNEISSGSWSSEELTMHKIWVNTLPISDNLGVDSNFFEHGGNSLTALQIVSECREKYSIAVTIQEIFEFQTIRSLCAQLGLRGSSNSAQGDLCTYDQQSNIVSGSRMVSQDCEIVDRVKVKGQFESICLANSLQQGFIYRYLHFPHAGSYIVQNLWQYHEEINVEKFRTCWIKMTKKYPTLRLRFDWESSQIIQIISADITLDFRYISTLISVEDLVQQDRQEGFNLGEAPLFRVYLIREGLEQFTCIFSNHHAIIDGISTALLLADLNDLYSQTSSNDPNFQEIDPAYIQTQEYIRTLNGRDEDWWRFYMEQRSDSSNSLISLLKHEKRHTVLREIKEIFSPKKFCILLEEFTVGELRKFASSHGFTLQSVVQYAWHKILRVFGTNREVTVTGLTFNGRSAPISGIQSSVGPYVNTLPLYVNHNTNEPVRMIRNIQKRIQEIASREYVNLGSLSFGEERLFDSIFVYENYTVGLPQGTTVFEKVDYPLVVVVKENTADILIQLTYESEIFETRKIEQFVTTLEQVLQGIPHGNLNLVSTSEAQHINGLLTGPRSKFDLSTKLQQLFDARLAQEPNAVALVTETERWTFSKMNEVADIICAEICANIYAKNPTNPIVLIFLDTPTLLPAAILGIFKAGGGYSPLDANLPCARIKFILTDISAYAPNSIMVVLTSSKCAQKLEEVLIDSELNVEKIQLDLIDYTRKTKNANAHENVLPGEIASVIYTSGTTGQPKGVVLKHCGLVNYCLEQTRTKFASSGDLVLSLLGWAFDGFWCALAPGIFGNSATAVLSPSAILDPASVIKFMIDQKVTHIVGNPLHLSQLNLSGVSSLKTILSAGSEITGADVTKLLATKAQILNGIGPTEASVISLWGEILTPDDLHIGRPIQNTELYILNEDLIQVPFGVIGELYIGGIGVSGGYLNSPDSEAFTQNSFGQAILHKSGDLVTLLSNGKLYYHGRKDMQVKVRGYRVNCSEIETIIVSYSTIDFAVVSLYEDNLVAFIVSREEISNDKIFKFLEDILPNYMIPSNFIPVQSIPLNSNGKVDYPALHKRVLRTAALSQDKTRKQTQPRNVLESQVMQIWAEILRNPTKNPLAIDDNYFQLGGDSITAIQIVLRIRQKLGIQVRVADIFKTKTIRQLVELLGSSESKAPSTTISETGILIGRVPLLPIQDWFLTQGINDPNILNQAFGVKVPQLDVSLLQSCINTLNNYHDSLRLRVKYDDNKLVQYYEADSPPPIVRLLTRLDIECKPDILTQVRDIFSLEFGPVWSVTYIEGFGDQLSLSARLYFVFHHMVFDSVSWRILINHLYELYHGNEFQPKGTSYRQWSTQLRDLYNSCPVENEKLYWDTIIASHDPYTAIIRFCDHHCTAKFALTEKLTHDLVYDSPRAYNTSTAELLLTALAYVLTEQTGKATNYITIEGNGREESLIEGVDLSHTTGWYTTMFPFKISVENSLGQTIVGIKEGLRAIPNKGIGYGFLIGYMTRPLPPIMFNYLGSFDRRSEWTFVNELTEPCESGQLATYSCISLDQKQAYQPRLAIDLSLIQAKLEVEIAGNLEDIDVFIQSYEREIQNVVDCTRLGRSYLTPSDLGFKMELKLLNTIQENREIEAIFRANSIQEAFIYYHLSHPQPPFAYHVQHTWKYKVEIDVNFLRQAWEILQANSPAMRLRFNWESSLVQIIDKFQHQLFEFKDFSYLSREDCQIQMDAILKEDSLNLFPLDSGPLFRVYLIKQGPAMFSSIFAHHHSIIDGWSLNNLYYCLHATYLDLATGCKVYPPIHRHQAYLEAQSYLQANYAPNSTWWKKYLNTIHEKCELSGLVKSNKSCEGMANIVQERSKTKNVGLDKELVEELTSAAALSGVTLNIIFLFTWHKVLSIYGSCSQTVVGIAISGRNLPIDGIESSIGCYINTLPTIFEQKGGTLYDNLKSLQNDILELSSNSIVRLSDILKIASLRDGERLFESVFVYENYPRANHDQVSQELSLRISNLVTFERQEFPLAVLVEDGERITCSVTYDTHLYDECQVNRLVTTFQSILSSIAYNPYTDVENLTYVNRIDYKELMDWAGTEEPFPDDILVQDILESWVRKTPRAIAVETEFQSLTFECLWDRINILAEQVQNFVEFDSKGRMYVPFYVTEPTFLMETIFGILRAGCAYVPLDPTLTKTRMMQMLTLIRPLVVLSAGSDCSFLNAVLAELDFPVRVIDIAKINWEASARSANAVNLNVPHATSSDPVYIVFTSGTTGEPKGVIIEHKSLVNTIIEMRKFICVDREVVLPLFGWGFDSIWSAIAVGILSGGTTVLASPSAILDPESIIPFCTSRAVTQIHGNPLLVQQLPIENISTLRTVCVAGQSIGPKFVREFRRRCPTVMLINGYGPTEVTVGTHLEKIWSEETITIGKCIANISTYVLDKFRIPVPIGVRGELFLGGVGVGRGYFHDPEKNGEVFLSNPFGPGKMYKTGDIVYWTEHGKLVYVGRRDSQTKIRGYRVDLSEIEAAVESFPTVQKCVVQKCKSGDQSHLICYAVSSSRPSTSEVFAHIEKILPEYMIPLAINFLSKLPLNSNGKLDITRLPTCYKIPIETDFKPPRTPLECILCEIWRSVLKTPENSGVSKIGISDNFFKLGGDSISSIQIVGQIRCKLGSVFPVTVRDILVNKTIEMLVQNVPYFPPADIEAVETATAVPDYSMESSISQNGDWVCEANSLQEGMVYHYKSEGRHADAYVVQKVINYGVTIDVAKMKDAWKTVHALYPGLRIKFSWRNQVYQIIEKDVKPIDWRDLTLLDESEFDDLLARDRLEGFDLQFGNLIRINFVQLPSEQRCILTIHHAVCDGWSTGILLENLHNTYSTLVENTPLPCQGPDITYMVAQQYLATTQNQHHEYWESVICGSSSQADWSSLSTATHEVTGCQKMRTVRPKGADVRIDRIRIMPKHVDKIRQIGTDCGVTPNAIFQLAWHRALRIFGNTQQTVVGTTVSGRDLPINGIQSSVGLFLNTLPIIISHVELDTLSGIGALQHIQEKTIQLNSKSNVKLSHLKGIQFDSIYAFENYPISHQTGNYDKLLKITYSEGISFEDYPLLLTVSLKGRECSLELQSSSSFCKEATNRLLDTVYQIIQNIIARAGNQMESYLYLPKSEIQDILNKNTFTIPTYFRTILHYFKTNVSAIPERIAVIFNDVTLTYAELDRLSSQVCQALLRSSTQFVGKDKLVPLFLDKGAWTHVGILGILKSGSAYVPIDPVYPIGRIQSILGDISAHVVVTTSQHAQKFSKLNTILVDIICAQETDYADLEIAEDPLPETLVYAIYTSGTTTGKPKGCLIEHRNLINYLEDTSQRLFGEAKVKGEHQPDVLLQLASTTFDPSIDQIFLALYNGFTCVVPSPKLWMDPLAFVSYCSKNGVTDIFGTPSMLKLFQLDSIPTLRSVRVAGEKLSQEAYNKIKGTHASFELANVFGPTETTVVCSYKKLTSFTYSVGQPIRNVSFFVTDPTGKQFVPVGTIGELYIGGAGVGRGYVNQPELNARHFISNPWTGAGKVYRSGDLVRRLSNGEIEFIGRNDSQVKVRGFRVELGEIASCLIVYPGITEAVVALKQINNSKQLVGYYVADSEITSTLEVFLANTLPDYMVPSVFIRIPQIPLTNNGKLDVNALPLPSSLPQNSSFIAAQSTAECIVTNVWAEVLGLQSSKIGTSDNFFSLGGDSISAVLIAEKLKVKFGKCCTATVRDVITLKNIHNLVRKCIPDDAVGISVQALGVQPFGAGPRPRLYDHDREGIFSHDKVQWVGKANSLQAGFVSQYLGRKTGEDAYAVQITWKYNYKLDAQTLEKSWRTAYSKFPGLRVRFDWSAELVQIIDKSEFCNLDWKFQDWSNLEPDAQDQKFESLRLGDRERYFDLGKGDLLRLYLVQLAPSQYRCLCSNHHSILDGWSSSILFSTVHEIYIELINSKNPELGIQEDVVYFRAQEQIELESFDHTEFLKNIIEKVDEQADFISLTPLSTEALNLNAFNQNEIDLTLLLRNFRSAEYNFTLNTLLQFTWHQVLRIFLRMNKTVVGTTISGRNTAISGISHSVGLYINTLPLVVNHSDLDNVSLIDALNTVQSTIFELNSKASARLRELHRPGQSGRLFESILVFENFPEQEISKWEESLGVTEFQVFEKVNFPLVVTARASGQSVQVTIQSSVSFKPSGLTSLLSTFQFVFARVINMFNTNPHALCNTLTYCHNPKLETSVSAPGISDTLVQRFKHIAAFNTDKVAIITEKRFLMYGELDTLTDNLAALILKIGGAVVGPNKFVALFLEKSEWIVIGILGVLKTGSAYVPIDPEHPKQRVCQILQDCGASVLVTNKGKAICSEMALDLNEIYIEQACEPACEQACEQAGEPACEPACEQAGEGACVFPTAEYSNTILKIPNNFTGNSLAYVIYTSGTSGEPPKGCLIEHQSVINLVDSLSSKYFDQSICRNDSGSIIGSNTKTTFDLNSSDEIILQLANYVYDLSVLQIWLALLNGHKILMPSKNLLENLGDLTDFMAQHVVTHVSGTPSFLKLFSWEKIPTLRRLVLGGEIFRMEAWNLISKSRNSFRIINEYGPTETTVTSSCLEMEKYSKGIGSPIANTTFYVMDENLRVLPDCVVGELMIGGFGLARGYLNRPELNATKFVEVKGGQRLYRTGDLVRRVSEGGFEFIGRHDSQVKIRGHRVELEEIEHAIRKIQAIGDVIVVANPHLVAYYISKYEISEQKFRNHLVQILPSFCVPLAFIQVEKFPVAITGKLDIRALPIPKFSQPESQILPSTKLESAISGIWSEILNIPKSDIGIDKDFLSLGGDSLLFMQMIQKVKVLTGFKVKVVELYREKTIRKVIRAIDPNSSQILPGVEIEVDKFAQHEPPQVNPVVEQPGAAQQEVSFHFKDHPEFEPYEAIEGIGARIFLFPPGLGGVSSYLGNLVPLLRSHPLVLFNNFYEFLKSRYNVRIPYDITATEYASAIKKLQNFGPYFFVGWSWGGALAFEIARQMAKAGYYFGAVFIIDSLFCLKRALSPSDAERLKRDNDISYFHDSPMTPELRLVKFVLFKATEVNTFEPNLSDEDNAIDERIYNHYVHNTRANYLDFVLPPQTSLNVITFPSNHFIWFENEEVVQLIGNYILHHLED